MRLTLYAMLGENDPRFDGNVARVHLTKRLGYAQWEADVLPAGIAKQLTAWLARQAGAIQLRSPGYIRLPRRHPEVGDVV